MIISFVFFLSKKRGLNWRAKEDEALCIAWVSIFKKMVVLALINQVCAEKYFEIHPDADESRTPAALTSRFKTINQQCALGSV